ncbi:hypothetical protein GCM10026982_53390 [Nocardiopsis aegyptia]
MGLLWGAIVFSTATTAFSVSYLYGYVQAELNAGESYRLLSGIVALAGTSALQLVLACLVHLAHERTWPAPRKGAALVVGLVLIAGVGAAAEHTMRSLAQPVQQVFSGQEHPTPDIPGRLSGDVQALDLPWDRMNGLEPISSGLLLELDDGVLAVSPETAEEIWRYRHPGAVAQSFVSPDMSTVVVELTPRGSLEDPEQVTSRVTIDAGSGEVLHTVEDRQRVLESLSAIDASDEGVPFEGENVIPVTGEHPPLAVYGASSGAQLWTFDGTPECAPDTSRADNVVSSIAVTETQVFASMYCLDNGQPPDLLTSVVHAFDSASGELIWTHEIEDATQSTGGVLATSFDGSLLYRYENVSRDYFTLDSSTGQEVGSGHWEGPGPEDNVWDSVLGEGILLNEGQTFSLTDASGETEHILEIPLRDEDGGRSWPMSATEEALYVVDWKPGAKAPATLTAYPWDGSEPSIVENVFGRDLNSKEHAGVHVTPGGVIVYAWDDTSYTALVTVT